MHQLVLLYILLLSMDLVVEGKDIPLYKDRKETKYTYGVYETDDRVTLRNSMPVGLYDVNFTTSGGMAHASSSLKSHPPMDAFISSGYWHSGDPFTVPQYLWFEFPESIRVEKYSFKTRQDDPVDAVLSSPSQYIFWASNHEDCSEESEWLILNEDTSGIPIKVNETKEEYVNNYQFYRCYGFKVTDVIGIPGFKPVSIGYVRFYTLYGESYLDIHESDSLSMPTDIIDDDRTTGDGTSVDLHEESFPNIGGVYNLSSSHGILRKSLVDFHEVNFTTSGGMAKASSSHWYHPPINAFTRSDFWHSGEPYTLPQSLWFEFPDPIRVEKYSFTSRQDNAVDAIISGPSKYIFWASEHSDCSEESHWVILNEDTSGTPFKESNEPKRKYVNNNHRYKCYGFKVTDVPGRNDMKSVTIGNIRFYSILDYFLM